MKQPSSIASVSLLSGVELDGVYTNVEAYYAAKLARFGARPPGVDWSCAATQWLRFVQLLKVCPSDQSFSLVDLGCGYGALAAFLAGHRLGAYVEYLGVDLSPDMVRRARRRHRGNSRVHFVVGQNVPEPADYVVASGIMSVMLGFSRRTWERYVCTTLVNMHRMSRFGFAVNFVTRPGQQSRSDQLYCTTVRKWVRFCEQELGRSVEILDDYGLQEFTLLARFRSSSKSAESCLATEAAERNG